MLRTFVRCIPLAIILGFLAPLATSVPEAEAGSTWHERKARREKQEARRVEREAKREQQKAKYRKSDDDERPRARSSRSSSSSTSTRSSSSKSTRSTKNRR